MSNDAYMPSCFANVYDYDSNGTFVEMEKAIPAKPYDFERITGYPFEMYCDFLMRTAKSYIAPNVTRWIAINSGYDDAYNDLMENYDMDNFICNVMDYMVNFKVKAYGDLLRISSYGVVKREYGDDLVIIDFGLTEDVYNNFYKK